MEQITQQPDARKEDDVSGGAAQLAPKQYTVQSAKFALSQIEKSIRQKREALQKLTDEIADMEQRKTETEILLRTLESDDLSLQIKELLLAERIAPTDVHRLILSAQPKPKGRRQRPIPTNGGNENV